MKPYRTFSNTYFFCISAAALLDYVCLMVAMLCPYVAIEYAFLFFFAFFPITSALLIETSKQP